MSNSPDDPLLHETHAKTDLRAFWREQAKWSQATFGSDKERGPTGPLKHLAKEAVEAQSNPTDLMEFVDCLFLTFDATRRAGFTFQQLCEAAWDKLEINKARKWQKLTTDDVVEHVREIEEDEKETEFMLILPDAPEGQAWKCPDCPSWCTLGDNASWHAHKKKHGQPSLIPQPVADVAPRTIAQATGLRAGPCLELAKELYRQGQTNLPPNLKLD